MVATCALINKVLLKFHTDLLRFLFFFHGLTNFFFFFNVLSPLSSFSMLQGVEFTWSTGLPRVGLVCFEEGLENI